MVLLPESTVVLGVSEVAGAVGSILAGLTESFGFSLLASLLLLQAVKLKVDSTSAVAIRETERRKVFFMFEWFRL